MWNLGLKMLKHIRNQISQNRTPVLAGGVFPTFAPEIAIEHPLINTVCVGEGENTMIDLCDHLAKGEAYGGVTNIWIKHNSGKISKNPISKSE